MTFHCPRCDAKTRVIETRAEVRTRKCDGCSGVFRTHEVEFTEVNPEPRNVLAWKKSRKWKRWSVEEAATLSQLRKKGLTIKEIANAMRRTPNSIDYFLNEKTKDVA
jgi:NAD-dependent SIR2 family protein deacetylase